MTGEIIWRCRTCGTEVVLHRGQVEDIAFGKLPEAVATAHDSHKCRPKETP